MNDLALKVLTICFIVSVFIIISSAIYLSVISFIEKKRNDADINLGEMDIESLKQLLKDKIEYPYCKSIRTDEGGNIALECKYATYILKIQEGKMIIDDKFKFFSNRDNIFWEKKCLKAYLEKIVLPESNVNPPKVFQNFRRIIKVRGLGNLSKAFTALVLILFILVVDSVDNRGIHIIDMWKSKGVSQVYFSDYSSEMTIGEALNATCYNRKWDSNKMGDNSYYVTFTGNTSAGNLLIIGFQIDGNSCSVKSMNIDGKDVTLLQGLLFEAIYESAKNSGQYSVDELFTDMNEEEPEKRNFPAEETDEDNIAGLHWDIDGTYIWEVGEDENARGAQIIIKTDENDNIRLKGSSWAGYNVGEFVSVDYSMTSEEYIEFKDEMDNVLRVYPTGKSGIYVGENKEFGGMDTTFAGTYQKIMENNTLQDSSDSFISSYDLSGHYESVTNVQSVLDISIYTEDTDNGSIGIADINMGDNQVSAEIYEISANYYMLDVKTGEEVYLSAYEEEDNIMLQLYVDDKYVTEYILTERFYS